MRIKRTHSLTIATFTILSVPLSAATVIINEDFQSTIYSNDTSLNNVNSDSATPGNNLFPGWYVDFASNNRVNSARSDGGGDVFLPQGDEAGVNQGIQFEYTNNYLKTDTSHNWSSTDEFSFSVNATEQSWNNSFRRYFGFQIRETGGSVIYTSQTFELAQYDTAHNNTGDAWAANQLFTANFNASDFTGGTEGSALTFEIAGLNGTDSQRGMFIDNVSLTLIPEPSGALLLGLSTLSLAFRRRRA